MEAMPQFASGIGGRKNFEIIKQHGIKNLRSNPIYFDATYFGILINW